MRGKKVGRGMGMIGRCPSPLESYPQMWTMAGDIRLRADDKGVGFCRRDAH